MTDIHISPSILSADLAKLGQEVETVINAGANSIHFDVMDNHYVPNLTFGPMLCQALKNYGVNAPIDVHIMASPVDKLINDFANAGASQISIHPETTAHLDKSLQLIKDRGCKAGLAINPATSLDCIHYVQSKLDYILIMMVNPGFGGQQLIETLYSKIEHCQQLFPDLLIQVDGGVNDQTIGRLYQAGARSFVAGSAIFNQGNYKKNIETLRQAAKN